jgi:hypothetical protein
LVLHEFCWYNFAHVAFRLVLWNIRDGTLSSTTRNGDHSFMVKGDSDTTAPWANMGRNKF